jgi:predicted TPR repeat methyltransferase
MLSKALPINPLPSNIVDQLRSVDDFFVCTKFTGDMVGSPIVRIGKNVYYRFMNFIYLPQPPESLDIKQVKKICDLRLEYFDELVDRELNKNVVATIADCIKAKFAGSAQPLRGLDFGCGSGLSSQLLLDCLPELDLMGVDISEKAVSSSIENGMKALLTVPGEDLPFEDEIFDVIIAVFVMHFNIDIPTLLELQRTLRTSGLFAFNVYQRDIDGVTEQLEEAGFDAIEVWERLYKIGDNHLVMSCRKLSK